MSVELRTLPTFSLLFRFCPSSDSDISKDVLDVETSFTARGAPDYEVNWTCTV